MRIQQPLNRLNRPPRYLLAFDTETETIPITDKESRLVWKAGCAIYHDRSSGDERRIKSTDVEDYVRFIIDCIPKRGTLWVYAHNVYFDFKVAGLHTRLPAIGFELGWFYFAGSGGNSVIVFKRGQQTIKFVNTFNYFPMKLEKIGDIVGLPKKSVDFNDVDIDTLLDYCMRDTEIVMRAMRLFHDTIEENLGVSVGLTSGATSFNAWVNMQSGEWIEFHDDPELSGFERDCYKGGRTEAFKLGPLRGTWTCVDINSMYPFIMRTTLMPLRVVKVFGVKPHFEAITGRDWWQSLSRFIVEDKEGFVLRRDGQRAGVVADVTITTDEPAIGIVDKNKLVFPVGTFRVTLACCEFEYAFHKGWINEIHAAEIWALGYPFNEFIDTCWNLRHEFEVMDNHGLSKCLKLVMNSLYGKFAQRKIEELYREPCDPESIKSEFAVLPEGDGVIWELCGQRVYMLTTKETTSRTHYPVAAQITAAARLYLWKLINTAGRENVAYCDTDSLFINSRGLSALRDYMGDTLGLLKVEWTDDALRIYGLKDYQTSRKVKRKGIKSDAVFVESSGAWRQTQFVGIRGDLAHGNREGILIKTIDKHLRRNYTKGTVLEDGSVVPFVFS